MFVFFSLALFDRETVSDELIRCATETENWFHLVHLNIVVGQPRYVPVEYRNDFANEKKAHETKTHNSICIMESNRTKICSAMQMDSTVGFFISS